MADLELATVAELFAEIKRRHRAVVLILEKETKVGDTGLLYNCSYDGGVATCLGLVRYGEAYLERHVTDAIDIQHRGENI